MSSTVDTSPATSPAQWVLRIACALEFAGHGWLALHANPAWVPLITWWGPSPELALQLLPVIGAIDLALAGLVLFKPIRGALLYMAIWGILTALMRPLSGQAWVQFIERGANWGAPLALLLLRGLPRSWRDLLR